MRKMVLLAGVAMCWAVPAAAQSGLDGRVGKLESEMRAVQRKVFPGGAGAVPSMEPQITGAPAPGREIGSPATPVIADLTQRVSSLEGQMASMTGQIEQTQYRMRQLEEQFAAYRKEVDARFGSAGPTPGMGGPVESVGTAPSASPPPGKKPDAPAPAAGKDPARAKLVAAVEKPSTSQPDEDEYIYGYRLWQAKFYPEAATQFKKVVADYPRSRRASYAQNLLGRSYLDDGKPSLASIAFYDNYKKMPDGERAPESLFYLGQSLMNLKKPADACKVYGELTDVYGTKISAQMQADITRARATAKCK
ncbi:MAG: YbgF trimerization domain-containing protein [Candidatus Sphingomonas colombiensis]|nr:YbgF trimerization domain-containing protein [Sphingomonas sp.]WEK43772.1 MAG: YbgF trimerization domain-containing protein [Sphingomonas sp.]